ncbi:TIR domain-containing protein [Qipengyuania psychrotolerans]|uniref:Nucleotide-binding protein n=1 Tax=Qipengyuania psychrotolerans TaxID=2867238 RepID=A0ABX8ZCE1_9SPHN|nr:nucleotide-binding protein [Qipengyuania psychrotolerans]QZD86676.1 nucleotide-binding protein [Qipengyuania psychrotolerans]
MTKPRIFIASSTESLDTSYAVQENLEHDTEITVWTQGVFEPSRYAMDDLASQLEESDFAIFVLAPEDVTIIRGEEHRTARDNVIFELGLFIGRLGRERCFILVPRSNKELHLPSDLLGITPLTYEADRTDGNLVASIGPSANKVRRAVERLGRFKPVDHTDAISEDDVELVSDENDIISLIQSWMGQRPTGANKGAIRYAEVDKSLGLVPGSAKKHIEQAAQRWNYVPERKGKDVILFRSA